MDYGLLARDDLEYYGSMANKWKLAIFGLASGIISTFVPPWIEEFVLSLTHSNVFVHIKNLFNPTSFDILGYSPGLVFGVVIVIFFIVFKKTKVTWTKSLLWILASIFSYYCAVQTTVTIYIKHMPQSDPNNWITAFNPGEPSLSWQAVAFFAGGLIGASLMLASFHFLLSRFWNLKEYLLLVFFGGVFALSALIPQIPFLYIIWQAGMAFALGWVLDRNIGEAQKAIV
jgi:hypothetical protein